MDPLPTNPFYPLYMANLGHLRLIIRHRDLTIPGLETTIDK